MHRAARAVVVVPQCMSEASSVCYAHSANSYIHYRTVHITLRNRKLSTHMLLAVLVLRFDLQHLCGTIIINSSVNLTLWYCYSPDVPYIQCQI